MREVRVLGVGATSFTGAGTTTGRLAYEAATAALADAGVAPHELSSVVCAAGGAPDLGELAEHAADPAPGSGIAALHLAWDAVASGADDLVLCIGFDGGLGDQPPHLDHSASAAAAYMRASGATERTFALVAAKNRLQGASNPRAAAAEPVDVAAVLRSPLVAWPLRDLMVATPACGAAAVVLATGERGERRLGARAPRIRACVVVRAANLDGAIGAALARAARLAYRRARLGPDDIDCAEIRDVTAADEVAAYEALQFAPEGRGPDLVDSGFTTLGGVLPVNTSGGAQAQGDASRAGPLAQLCELTWQLRGEAGRRQVAGARVGLAATAAPDGDSGEAHVGLAILGP